MCGRYVLARLSSDLAVEFDAEDATAAGSLRPRYNVAPTARVPVVRHPAPPGELAGEVSEPRRVISTMRWGLVPSWAKDPGIGARMINARAESVATKPAFRAAFVRRRCLVPADGWYEWTPREHGPGKQAYYLTPADGGVLAFAGLWETWGSGEELLRSCAVVTTAAIGPLAGIHDRMPLMLPQSRWAEWLGEDGERSPEALLAPPPDAFVADLELRPVGPAVGNVRNDGPDLLTEHLRPTSR